MVRITQGTAHDIDIIVNLVSELLSELDGKPFHTMLSKKEILQWITDKEYIVFIARDEKDGLPIGVITLTESKAIYTNGTFATIEEFYIKPRYRSKLIGKKMLDHVISFAKTKGWKRLEVGAPEKEHWMRTFNFYHMNNFIEIGPRLKYHL